MDVTANLLASRNRRRRCGTDLTVSRPSLTCILVQRRPQPNPQPSSDRLGGRLGLAQCHVAPHLDPHQLDLMPVYPHEQTPSQLQSRHVVVVRAMAAAGVKHLTATIKNCRGHRRHHRPVPGCVSYPMSAILNCCWAVVFVAFLERNRHQRPSAGCCPVLNRPQASGTYRQPGWRRRATPAHQLLVLPLQLVAVLRHHHLLRLQQVFGSDPGIPQTTKKRVPQGVDSAGDFR